MSDDYERELRDELMRLHAERNAMDRIMRRIENDVEDIDYRIKVCSETLRKVK